MREQTGGHNKNNHHNNGFCRTVSYTAKMMKFVSLSEPDCMFTVIVESSKISCFFVTTLLHRNVFVS